MSYLSGPLKLTIEHLGAAPKLFPGVIGSSGIFSGADDANVFAVSRVDESALPDYPRKLKPGRVYYDNADTGRPSLNIPVRLGGTDDNYFTVGADEPPPPPKGPSIVPIVLAVGAWFAWNSLRGK